MHFLAASRDAVVAAIEATGLRALVHPLTDDDLADHTTLAHWIGEPIELDVTVLDPAGEGAGGHQRVSLDIKIKPVRPELVEGPFFPSA